VVAAGSQKALMAPPGLAFAAVNEAALARAADGTAPSYYFDWQATAAGQRKDPPDSPFTPAVGLVMALDVALGLIEEEGLDNVLERHRVLGRAAREAVKALDLELFGPEDENASVVTAVKLPDSIDGAKVPKTMRDGFGVTIAGGQGKLKGKIARIAHCGYFGAFDIVTSIAAFELTLRELGHEVELGTGVGAALRVLAEAGVPVAAPA
jgi:aspartate aminotransferase-like enzyme